MRQECDARRFHRVKFYQLVHTIVYHFTKYFCSTH
jgi:hypothetical protein